LCPPMRSMALICAGRVQKKPIVINNEIKIQDIVNLTATSDHRFGDAATFLPFYNVLKGYLEDPLNFKPDNYKRNLHWSER